jgi:hypothetical protein
VGAAAPVDPAPAADCAAPGDPAAAEELAGVEEVAGAEEVSGAADPVDPVGAGEDAGGEVSVVEAPVDPEDELAAAGAVMATAAEAWGGCAR